MSRISVSLTQLKVLSKRYSPKAHDRHTEHGVVRVTPHGPVRNNIDPEYLSEDPPSLIARDIASGKVDWDGLNSNTNIGNEKWTVSYITPSGIVLQWYARDHEMWYADDKPISEWLGGGVSRMLSDGFTRVGLFANLLYMQADTPAGLVNMLTFLKHQEPPKTVNLIKLQYKNRDIETKDKNAAIAWLEQEYNQT